MMIILSFHPLAQAIAIILGVYAACMGYKRIQSLHYDRKVVFNKKRHVVVGGLSLAGLTFGMAGGAIIATQYLNKPLLVGMHGKGALVLLPFLVFGLFTGGFLYLKPKKRNFLPAVHGMNNLIVLILAIFQMVTGLRWLMILLNI